MALSLAQMKKRREELDRKIKAAQKKNIKKKATGKKGKKKQFNFRKRYPNLSSSLDRAANDMFS